MGFPTTLRTGLCAASFLLAGRASAFGLFAGQIELGRNKECIITAPRDAAGVTCEHSRHPRYNSAGLVRIRFPGFGLQNPPICTATGFLRYPEGKLPAVSYEVYVDQATPQELFLVYHGYDSCRQGPLLTFSCAISD